MRLLFDTMVRESIVTSQALGAIVTAALDHLVSCITLRQEAVLRQISCVGLLVHSVCLLSTYGNESAMLDDFAGAYANLEVVIRLKGPSDDVPSNLGDARTAPLLGIASVEPTLSATQGPIALGKIVVSVSIHSSEAFEWITSHLGSLDIKLVQVLFNLGVNEMQTLANATRSTGLQTEINRQGVSDLESYFRNTHKLVHLPTSAQEEIPAMLGKLAFLVEEEARSGQKCVDLLLTSCRIASLLNGARTTSCKSAKDRTSMFQTLEVAQQAEAMSLIDR